MESLPRWAALAAAGLFIAGPGASPGLADDASATNTTSGGDPSAGVVENSVVKIFSTERLPDLYKPWTKGSPVDVTGSGVVIGHKRILTNAHVVAYASDLQIQANQAGDKISATVEAIAPGIDLAVLKLDDESFFDTHPPLPRAATLPEIKDAVYAYGYPEGGNSLSITKGIVSRIEFAPFYFGVSGLRVQIDAAINPGNSGGPAIANGKMIGLADSVLAGAQNIGYIIPCEEIELFLQDIADGHYDGKPAMHECLQTLENPALRSFLKLDPAVKGMVVEAPYQTNADYPLKEWDVITKIGDTPIDDQGMVELPDDLRVNFEYLIQHVAKNGTAPLTVVRAGKQIQINLPVPFRRPMVVPALEDTYPSYFIYGPLVFTPATKNFFGELGDNGYARWQSYFIRNDNPVVQRYNDRPAFDGEQLVVVASPFLPHRLAEGYSDPSSEVVSSINGVTIKNLKQLVAVLRDTKDDFITVKFAGLESESLVFPRQEMLKATDEILSDNDIRSQGSPDMMAVWNAAAGK